MADRWVLYGATGYTGELLAEEAVRRGHKPVLAGRSEEKLAKLAGRLGLEHRAVAISDSQGLRQLLDGAALVLHAAGPFVDTSEPMVQACLDASASYLDITGELNVLEAVFARGAEAMARGIALLPAVGFDVVPTDCLAKHVAEKVPGATDLEIAVAAISQPSAGTAKSMVGIITAGGKVRRDGRLVSWPLGRGSKRVRFPSRDAWVLPSPLAELSTAYRSTKIQNITTYSAQPTQRVKQMSRVWPLTALALPVARLILSRPLVQQQIRRAIETRVHGPDEKMRQTSRAYAWARASGPRGSAEAWIETAEGYEFTKHAAILCVERVLKLRPTGATTPALAFGAEFALEVPGTKILDSLP